MKIVYKENTTYQIKLELWSQFTADVAVNKTKCKFWSLLSPEETHYSQGTNTAQGLLTFLWEPL